MRRVSTALSVIAALLLVIASVRAQAPDTIALGEGLAVQRRATWCGASVAVPIRCQAWEPMGFAFPSALVSPLTFARTWAVVPTTGRILAALSNASGPFLYTGFAVRMLASNDRGATWAPVTWRWVETANLIVFEPGSAHGVAAGDGGYVWTTDDGGVTWVDHGGSSGTTFTELVVAPREIVLVDSNGNAWRMSGGSFGRDLLVTDPSVHATAEGDAIVVRTATEEIRIRHGHGVDRHTRR